MDQCHSKKELGTYNSHQDLFTSFSNRFFNIVLITENIYLFDFSCHQENRRHLVTGRIETGAQLLQWDRESRPDNRAKIPWPGWLGGANEERRQRVRHCRHPSLRSSRLKLRWLCRPTLHSWTSIIKRLKQSNYIGRGFENWS